jgi:hypothetical protein
MALVHPASGRATITATLNGALLTIPPRRNWFVVLFLGAWTGAWAFGGGMALLNLFKPDMPLFARGFLLFWLFGWAAGLWFVGRTVHLQFAGREVISVTRETLTITRPGRWVTRPASYAIGEVRRLRALPSAETRPLFRSQQWPGMNLGALAFDHGMRSVTFASGIDEPEARYILNILREKGLLSDANLA